MSMRLEGYRFYETDRDSQDMRAMKCLIERFSFFKRSGVVGSHKRI